MGDMVTTIFSSFGDVITNLAKGLKDAFLSFIYADPAAAEKTLSAPAEFFLIFMGISLAVGCVFGVFRLLRGRRV